MNNNRYLLIFTCKDTFGIIAEVTAFLSAKRAFICELSEFGDTLTGRFFLRAVFEFPENTPDLSELSASFTPTAKKFEAEWKFIDTQVKQNGLILVSKLDHCLNDLLYRVHSKRLTLNIKAVVSNHTLLENTLKAQGIPFLHLPLTEATKSLQEDKLLALIEEEQIELVILARYMQILSPRLTEKLAGKIINIHHSFLPSFKGAKPYHQAFERGVKIIGATAHYVTAHLDEGPIIEQEVKRVDHSRTPEDLVSIGYDIEAQVLARAVSYHTENRIFLNGSKTVIFK